MQIILCFHEYMKLTVCSRLLHIGRTCLTNYWDNIRGELYDWIQLDPIMFLGSGPYESDEMVIQHVWYSKEEMYRNVWIQSIYERDTGILLLYQIKNRSSKVLLPNIEKNIERGAIICTDDWPAYFKLKNTYKHFTVNHSIKEYSRPELVEGVAIDIHVNSLEGIHSSVRHHFASKSRRDTEKLDLHLAEIMYRHSGRNLTYPLKCK